ncbi:EscU/YscU/HrcU family type III secretion system export apparatus switch protein [Metabacillus fastidiosus]|uniref:EscU/YscU/HrcU family type III secretion system export apparatus switch protein n=1 Tax=Metabacillus fastidiosus TaxID=1458 RepID=UPI002DBF75A2|nr:EscU/YscU/HrcU family type III secretion system export apparatus switch protein [Metabacillus fastidiosus]MEC2076995.1 EscU/YscU/HrcU family type III secretion system export apparatus switch protein [Metabacillus fastidiosus]
MKEDVKKKRAVALTYDKELTQAPKVIAKGKGYIAENIIKEATKNNVHIQEDPSLVEVLSKLEIHQQIPEELYEAVAEIFAFIYQIDNMTGKKK